MMQIKKHVSNVITLGNLLCGCIALVFASSQNFLMAFCWVGLGIFLDFFDGFFARFFKVSSPLGLQLDSLADMVTSGVVPGYVMFQLLSLSSSTLNPLVPYCGFIITLGACYRLANFNIDERQTDSFIGLPAPANALLIMSLPLVLKEDDSLLVLELFTNSWFLLFIILVSTYIMNAELPLFSLKIKQFSFKTHRFQLLFLIVSVFFLVFFRFLGISITIVWYVLLSLLYSRKKKVV